MKATVARLAVCFALATMTLAMSPALILANYDDLTRQIVDSPVPTYKYLNYTAWDLGNIVGEVVPVRLSGVQVQSPPNAISATVTSQIRGTPAFTVVSPYNYVSPYDFYFICVAETEQGVVSPPARCTITVAGFRRGSNQESAIASYTYTPPPKDFVGKAPMIHAVLPDSFHAPLYNITVAQDDPLVRVIIDSFSYALSK